MVWPAGERQHRSKLAPSFLLVGRAHGVARAAWLAWSCLEECRLLETGNKMRGHNFCPHPGAFVKRSVAYASLFRFCSSPSLPAVTRSLRRYCVLWLVCTQRRRRRFSTDSMSLLGGTERCCGASLVAQCLVSQCFVSRCGASPGSGFERIFGSGQDSRRRHEGVTLRLTLTLFQLDHRLGTHLPRSTSVCVRCCGMRLHEACLSHPPFQPDHWIGAFWPRVASACVRCCGFCLHE